MDTAKSNLFQNKQSLTLTVDLESAEIEVTMKRKQKSDANASLSSAPTNQLNLRRFYYE